VSNKYIVCRPKRYNEDRKILNFESVFFAVRLFSGLFLIFAVVSSVAE